MKKNYCPACNALEKGIRSRVAYQHSGCEFDTTNIALTKVEGRAILNGKPSPETLNMLNELAENAYNYFQNHKSTSIK